MKKPNHYHYYLYILHKGLMDDFLIYKKGIIKKIRQEYYKRKKARG